MPDLRLEGASKFYKVEKQKLVAVQDINLTVEQGEFVFFNRQQRRWQNHGVANVGR